MDDEREAKHEAEKLERIHTLAAIDHAYEQGLISKAEKRQALKGAGVFTGCGTSLASGLLLILGVLSLV